MTGQDELNPEELIGLWRRAVIRRRWRWPDRGTEVHWLQGPRFFVDLRQPTGRPDFAGVRCLRDIRPEHLPWLARQEGFAGNLSLAGRLAQWHRVVNFQPPSGEADRAPIRLEGEILHEDGVGYYEEWHREAAAPGARWGFRLSAAGTTGFIIRVGDRFMVARDRWSGLPHGESLGRRVSQAPDLAAKQDLLDCEISLGRVEADGTWRIERSTLPFKVGGSFEAWMSGPAGRQIEVADIDASGEPMARVWTIAAADQDDGTAFLGGSRRTAGTQMP